MTVIKKAAVPDSSIGVDVENRLVSKHRENLLGVVPGIYFFASF